jgi:hypothetical protein
MKSSYPASIRQPNRDTETLPGLKKSFVSIDEWEHPRFGAFPYALSIRQICAQESSGSTMNPVLLHLVSSDQPYNFACESLPHFSPIARFEFSYFADYRFIGSIIANYQLISEVCCMVRVFQPLSQRLSPRTLVSRNGVENPGLGPGHRTIARQHFKRIAPPSPARFFLL